MFLPRGLHRLGYLPLRHQYRTMSTPPAAFWTAPSPALYDFRSDTVTTPTAAQYLALPSAPIYDAILSPLPLTHRTPLTTALGKPASLFVSSGTLSNLLALRALLATPPPHTILCDARSHIFNYEAGNIATVWGIQLIPITPSSFHLTLSDIQKHWIDHNYDIHCAPTPVVALENTLGTGRIHPLASINEIADWVHHKGGKIHLDGARIWHAAEATGIPVSKLVEKVDTVSVCCSKGLGAPVGGFLVGDEITLQQARKLRKMLGGAIRQEGVLTAMCEAAYREVVMDGKLAEVHRVAKELEDVWRGEGGEVSEVVESNMLFLEMGEEGMGGVWEEVAEEEGVQVTRGGRVVVHFQNVGGRGRLEAVMREFWRRWRGEER